MVYFLIFSLTPTLRWFGFFSLLLLSFHRAFSGP